MKNLSLGVIGTSRKEDEKRFPIHPDHLSRLPEDIRKQLIFETLVSGKNKKRYSEIRNYLKNS